MGETILYEKEGTINILEYFKIKILSQVNL